MKHMSTKIKFNYLLLLFCLFFGEVSFAQQLAFPGAQGFGAYSVGGRGGKVIEVTNLQDDGEGSLRAAIEAEEARTVVFRVSGTIELASMLTITNPDITIAGQTAPGDGICLKNFPLHVFQTHDVIIRCLRIRPGIGSGLIGSEIDGIELRDCKNVIIDHCSVSYTVDECINTWHNTENITVQWCMFVNPLNRSVHEKGAHGYGGSLGGKNASYLHNLFAHAAGRNPSVAGNNLSMTENMDFRNNVIFNYGHRSGDGKPGSINFVGNYYKPGPATNPEILHRIVKVDNAQRYGFDAHWYIDGNFIEGYPESLMDNWKYGVEWSDGTSPEINRLKNPCPLIETRTESARDAFKSVVASVGVVVPGRDSHEKLILAQLVGEEPVNGTGIIDAVEETGGWPLLESTLPPVDTDHDGMPDEWEIENKLNPRDSADGALSFENGYTNLEKYLNSLMAER